MNGEGEQQISATTDGGVIPERGFRRAWTIVCVTLRWLLCAAYFFPACIFLILVGIVIDPRKNDGLQRAFCRTTMKLAGAKLVVRQSPGFDPKRTCFFLVNHVNLFDPFVLYCTIPQFFRGLELESHFRIPVYGWMMRRFGNIPVPDSRRPSDLKRMWRMTRAALDSGISLAAFAEGRRTLDGRLGPFEDGVFRMALQFGTPIIPVSMVGAFEFHQKKGWMLRPGQITVYLHDVIETQGLPKSEYAALRDRVHAIMSQPIDEYYRR